MSVDIMNRDFEDLVEKNCQDATIKAYFAVSVLFVMAGFLIYWGIKISLGIFLIGLGVLFAGFYCINRSGGEFKGGKFWVGMIKENPDYIVWIKPIVTKHTVGFVLVLYKEKKFQFLTKHGTRIVMECSSDKDQQVFFEGIKQHLPNAQIGYSLDTDILYNEGPSNFIKNLQNKGLYHPVKWL
jgi:hypothetical protein